MSGNPPPPISPQDIQNPYAAEFLHHPDFRATAGFLLGWVFWSSVSYAYRTQFFQLLGHICWSFLRRRATHTQATDVEARASANLEKSSLRRESRLTGIQGISNEAALVFTLNLCFAFASFAEFCSILAYDPGGADTACAFTVAWANMAAQAARLLGLALLVLQLKQRGASNMEFYGLCAALVIALSFILAYNATNTGDMVHIVTLGNTICVKIQYLPTALLTSIGFILLELYVTFRLLGWEDRKYGWRAMVAKSANLQVARGSSLLLIDILTFGPNVIMTNVLAQFVPFSLGSLIVLIAFNYKVDSLVRSEPEPERPMHISRTPTPLPHSERSSPILWRVSPIESPNRGAAVLDISAASRPAMAVNKELPPVVVPNSAPPRIGDKPVFADLQGMKILPFQVKYIEQMERHIHTGPILPLRPKRQRPHVQVVIEDMEPARQHSIIGSDIVRLPSAVSVAKSERRERRDTRETKETKIWSPTTTATPSDYTMSQSSSAATPTTTVRHSNLSTATSTFNRSLSNGSRQMLSAMLSRQGSRKARSPAEGSSKMPWRAAPRTSFASGRTFGGRDELPPVAEGNTEASGAGGSKSGSWRGSHSSAKHLVISRPHSLRASRPSSPGPSRLGLQLPGLPSNPRPSSSQHLTVPDRVQTPTTPDTPSSFRASSRYIVPSPLSPPSASFERAQGSGRLRGPRSPPMSGSLPHMRSAWPTADPAYADFTPGHQRKRSGSCPELPPLDLGANLRTHPSVRR